MIFVLTKGFDIKYQWGLYVIPKSGEACLQLSKYYRIYMRAKKSRLVPHGGRHRIFEPGWIEYCPDFVPGEWRAPVPSKFTRFISWFVPALRRRIEMYSSKERYYTHIGSLRG